MKNTIKKTLTAVVLTLGLLLTLPTQGQPPPPPPSGHGDEGNQNAGNAPIDGGLGIMLALGAAYGGKKIYDMRKERLEE
ncbi:MAG: hypothetical protein K9G61_07095 [Bacteroidales bacterium]|nr:hypothetical protein [Bacteroidales bacterium]